MPSYVNYALKYNVCLYFIAYDQQVFQNFVVVLNYSALSCGFMATNLIHKDSCTAAEDKGCYHVPGSR